MAPEPQEGLVSGREAWPQARLIPQLGTRDTKERERRATSCLLAVMHGVPEFGNALLKDLKAPKTRSIETFTEVRFKTPSGKTATPDGAIFCERGGTEWTCLVEVKTGSDRLRVEQVTEYVDVAREKKFDAVLTISPEITASVEESPVKVSGQKLRSVKLYHYSWWQVITEAIVQLRYRGVSDTDQEWVLQELIHYLTSPNSGALGFDDMGKSWVACRAAARNGTLGADRSASSEVAERWDQFCRALALRFSQVLGADVRSYLRRKQSTQERLSQSLGKFLETGTLVCRFDIPDSIGPLGLHADLRTQQTTTSVEFKAPRTGTPRGRIGWLKRQLRDCPEDLLIEASFPNVRDVSAANLGSVREDHRALCHSQDPRRPPRSFTLSQIKPMGRNRGHDDGSFVKETTKQTLAFYDEVVAALRPWQPPVPQAHPPDPPVEDAPSGDEPKPDSGPSAPQG